METKAVGERIQIARCSGRAKIATLRSERNDQSGQGEIANSPVGDFLV